MKKLGIAIAIALGLNAAFTLFLFNSLKSTIEQKMAPQPPPLHFANYQYGVPQLNTSPSSSFYVPENFVGTAGSVTKTVVNIRVKRQDSYLPVSGGSGVILSQDGYIITNHHVIEGGGKIEVTLFDKHSYVAEVAGIDPTTDLALLKINASGLQPLRFANSDEVKVGEWVLAVGNPFNLTSTVTAGIVSARGRNLHILQGQYSIENFIQTDAVVNPGNSGGALVNTQGELIGIISAIMSESGSFEGYSFAIPSNLVEKIMLDLKEFGKPQRALLGVTIRDVNERIAEDFNLDAIEGVLVSTVGEGTSAALADIRKDDIILSVNGIKTNTASELQEQIARFRPGDEVSLDIVRNGREIRKSGIVLKGAGELQGLNK